MVKVSYLLMVLGSLGVSQVAAAADAAPAADATASITWEQFKEGCQNPAKFNNQQPPQNIKILCTDVQKEFISTAPGEIPLPGERRISYAVYSNKYHVNPEQKEVPVSALRRNGSCLRFKEVERTFTLEKWLTCDEIRDDVKNTENLYATCTHYLDQSRGGGSNPRLIETKDTGRSIDTCSATVLVTQ